MGLHTADLLSIATLAKRLKTAGSISPANGLPHASQESLVDTMTCRILCHKNVSAF